MSELNCDVRVHGSLQLEIKSRYPVPDRHNLSYDLDLYLFTPGQLEVNERRHTTNEILENLRVNTRYTTPGIPLNRLMDESFQLSPMTRINRFLDSNGIEAAPSPERILYEIRTLVNIYRAELRDTRRMFSEQVKLSYNPEVLLGGIREHVKLSRRFLKRFRAMMPRFLDPHIPQSLKTAIEWADESMSLATGTERLKLFKKLESHADLRVGADLLRSLLGKEEEYRHRAGYRSNADPDDDRINEDLLYRESVLKKWSQSAMYMSSELSPSLSRIAQILAAAAAAVAMGFAVVATVLANRLFAAYSIPWALLVVLAYIFKDRIKELLRTILIKLVPRLIADEIGILVDPVAETRVGRTRSTVRFSKPRDLPTRIVEMRDVSQNPFRSILPEEDVVHYHRRIQIDGKRLRMNHQRLDSITEILRLKLDIWLKEMDSPEDDLTYFDDDEIGIVPAARVYHANAIVTLTGEDGTRHYRFRLILSRNGLLRIEPVATIAMG